MRPALKHGCRSCDIDSPEELAADVTFSAGETAAPHLIQTAAADVGSASSFGEEDGFRRIRLVIIWDKNAANVTQVYFFLA